MTTPKFKIGAKNPTSTTLSSTATETIESSDQKPGGVHKNGTSRTSKPKLKLKGPRNQAERQHLHRKGSSVGISLSKHCDTQPASNSGHKRDVPTQLIGPGKHENKAISNENGSSMEKRMLREDSFPILDEKRNIDLQKGSEGNHKLRQKISRFRLRNAIPQQHKVGTVDGISKPHYKPRDPLWALPRGICEMSESSDAEDSRKQEVELVHSSKLGRRMKKWAVEARRAVRACVRRTLDRPSTAGEEIRP